MRTFSVITITLLTFLAVTATADAQEIYDWPSKQAPALVHTKGAVFFIGKDKTVWRVYHWRPGNTKRSPDAYFTDMDGDSKVDVVGAGKPSFGVNTTGDPMWFSKGCGQLLVADVAADDKPDVVCINGKKIEAKTYDNQMIWSISLGKTWDWCVLGDVNGDLKADVECKQRHSKNYSRIDGATGHMLAASTPDALVKDPKTPGIEPVSADILQGKKEFDIDGDGTPEESLLVDGKAVAVRSRSHKAGLARIELSSKPIAALVKDLDGDKKADVIIVTKKEIAIWSAGDKKPKKFSLNPRHYKREPVAELQAVYANGFTKDDDAKKTVTDLNKKLSACYSSQVRRNQFAGVGRMLLEVYVDNKGKVKKVERNHSSLPDEKVVKCAESVLKHGKYPKASGDSATVNVTLRYSFRDK